MAKSAAPPPPPVVPAASSATVVAPAPAAPATAAAAPAPACAPSEAALGAVKAALLSLTNQHVDLCTLATLEAAIAARCGSLASAEVLAALYVLSDQNLLVVRGDKVHVI